MAVSDTREADQVRLPYEVSGRRGATDKFLPVLAALYVILAIVGFVFDLQEPFTLLVLVLLAVSSVMQAWVRARARLRVSGSHFEVVETRTRSWRWEQVREIHVDFGGRPTLEVVTDAGLRRVRPHALAHLGDLDQRIERRRFEAALRLVAETCDVHIKVTLPRFEEGRSSLP